jgi:hypothetical protein
MPAADAESLRSIKTFAQLVKYLRDELGWPIESDDYDDLTFEYQPEELGLDAKAAVKIKEIKQLRPLHTNQPWGVFFVNFEPKRLPVVVLRRILSALVVKKRQSRPSQAAWKLHDLLFISSYGESAERTITFAHFSEGGDDGDLPTLRVLAWDDQDTVLHLADAHRTLRDKLRYPDIPDDVDAWRQTWSSAFTLRHREVITTSKALAVRLAELATAIRKRANAVLTHESEKGPLRKLHAAFQQSLIHDLSADDFADMYAQTIAYGLLTASVSRYAGPGEPAPVSPHNLTDLVPITNPFLKDLLGMFLTVGGRKGKLDFDELGVNDVAELLKHKDTNMEAVLRDFGDRNPQEDPVIHFYELFLKEYDPKKRMKRGVFYTPRPVVSYIVRSVHELLQTEFGLQDGLASTATWADVQKQFAIRNSPFGIPAGTDPNSPFVVILDPAVGTATFLVEVIDVIHKTMKAKWLKAGHMELEIPKLWNEYVPRYLLPRLYGYELMMAPYAIAHMKIGLKLHETGYRFGSDERARVYLTNSLEPPIDEKPQREFEEWAPALAHEAQAVNAVKRERRFTAVVGNPPYAGISSNMTDEAQRLVEAYKLVDGQALNERKLWLQDDYVKFIRMAQSRIESAGCGALGFINNHAYLDNPTFRGMRQSLMDTFDQIAILDLHGNERRHERAPDGSEDKNVFDIMQGVSIGFFVRGKCSPTTETSKVSHSDVWGTRQAKYDWLMNQDVHSTKSRETKPNSPFYFFVPRDELQRAEYEAFPQVISMFPENVTGIVTARDEFAIDFDDEPLLSRIEALRDTHWSDEEIRAKFFADKSSSKYPPGDSRGWKLPAAREAIRKDKEWRKRCVDILYRPFDKRRIYYVPWIVDWPRVVVMPNMLRSTNVALAWTRPMSPKYEFSVLATSWIIDQCTIGNKSAGAGISYLGPLYSYAKTDVLAGELLGKREGEGRRPNLSPPIVKEFSGKLKLRFVSDGAGDLIKTFGPVNVFDYLYAVFYSPGYRSRYAEFLKIDFPRVPFTADLDFFRELARLGGELVALHLVESLIQTSIGALFDRDTRAWRYQHADGCKPPILIRFTGPVEPVVEKVSYANETVWIDKAQRVGFAGVPEDVWNFHIGGYQVCAKWLKDRKGRVLSADDIGCGQGFWHQAIFRLCQ